VSQAAYWRRVRGDLGRARHHGGIIADIPPRHDPAGDSRFAGPFKRR